MIVNNTGENMPKLYLIDHLIVADLSDDELKRIADADWYIAYLNRGVGDPNDKQLPPYLMADGDQLGDFDSEYFIHADDTVSKDLGGVLVEVLKVSDVLRRWSIEDGFYTV